MTTITLTSGDRTQTLVVKESLEYVATSMTGLERVACMPAAPPVRRGRPGKKVYVHSISEEAKVEFPGLVFGHAFASGLDASKFLGYGSNAVAAALSKESHPTLRGVTLCYEDGMGKVE